MPVSAQAQRALAFEAKQIRNDLCAHNRRARQWDEGGIAAQIAKVAHLHHADVALAVIRAADDPELDTPGAIANTRASCWRERGDDRPTTTDAQICPSHGVQHHGPICPSCKADQLGHDASPAAQRQHQPKPPLRELIAAAENPQETQ